MALGEPDAPRWPENMVRYINSNPTEDLGQKALVDRFDISSRQISRLFQKHLRMGVGVYVRKVRFSKACGLMATSELKVTEIAELTGYGSQITFSRTFKQMAGVSPSQWRHDKKKELF